MENEFSHADVSARGFVSNKNSIREAYVDCDGNSLVLGYLPTTSCNPCEIEKTFTNLPPHYVGSLKI